MAGRDSLQEGLQQHDNLPVSAAGFFPDDLPYQVFRGFQVRAVALVAQNRHELPIGRDYRALGQARDLCFW